MATAASASAACLALGQWLDRDPYRPIQPPDWTLRRASLRRLLGEWGSDAAVAEAAYSGITTADVFAHFGAELIALDPDIATLTQTQRSL